MNCFAYLRVSGAGQVDAYGFDRQLEACHKFAESQGWTITEVFREEGVSGTKDADRRPSFVRMLETVQGLDEPIVLVEHLDRLARFYRVQEELLNTLATAGITLYAANTGENVTEAFTDSPMRRFLVQVQGCVAELDRSQTIVKLTKGRAAKRASGGKAEGRYPFGHDPKRPAEKPVLALMKFMKAEGNTSEQIADALNAKAHVGRSGCTWKPATVAKILRRS
jgi:DNA invertase Pin-like site-specific DNA recombinase